MTGARRRLTPTTRARRRLTPAAGRRPRDHSGASADGGDLGCRRPARSSRYGGSERRTMTTVLVVEDEAEIARVVRDYLRDAGFEVFVVGEGGLSIARVRSAKPDLMVLDLGLPKRDGLDVAREIRRWSTTPIVV